MQPDDRHLRFCGRRDPHAGHWWIWVPLPPTYGPAQRKFCHGYY